MYLKDRSNAQGQCYPAIGTIAKELHLSSWWRMDYVTAAYPEGIT